MNLVTTNDVRITTAAVSIQVLRIGSKQMTLTVFRQLPHKDIFDKDGKLIADPWGWVNYDHQGGTPFVFSHEDVLYRSGVYVEIHHQLIVEADYDEEYIEAHFDRDKNCWVPSQRVKTLNGKWKIVSKKPGPPRGPLRNWWWNSQEGAQAHLENRLKSITVLEAAPQLFIAV